MDDPAHRPPTPVPVPTARGLRLRERLLVEWVAQASVGDELPEPWKQASNPLVSMIRTLVELGVMDPPAPGTARADIARDAGAAARAWLERNPPAGGAAAAPAP